MTITFEDNTIEDIEGMDIEMPEPSELSYLSSHLHFLMVPSKEFKGILNRLEDSIDHAITCIHEALYSRKHLIISHFDPRCAQTTCYSILRMTEKGSTAMTTLSNIPTFWINLERSYH